MNREQVRKARHDFRAYNRAHAHVAYMKFSINDYGDFAPRPDHYGFASRLTRCADPLLDAKRIRERCLARVRSDRAYRAEREAKSSAARAAMSKDFLAVLDRVSAVCRAGMAFAPREEIEARFGKVPA